jgi:hypothetical protein
VGGDSGEDGAAGDVTTSKAVRRGPVAGPGYAGRRESPPAPEGRRARCALQAGGPACPHETARPRLAAAAAAGGRAGAHGAWGTGGWRAHVVEAARRIPMPREFAAAAGRAGMTGVGQAEAVWRRLCLQLEQGMEDGWVEAAVQEVQAAVVRDGDRAWHAAKPRLEEEVLSPPHLSFPLSSLPSSILPT